MDIELTCPQEFEIRAPRLFLVVGLIILIIVVAILSVAGVYLYNGKLDLNLVIVVLCSQLFFLSVSILCLCIYRKDSFKYNNGEFLCKRVLRKVKVWHLEDVSCVVANIVRGGINIEFWSKDNKRIIIFTDDECCIWKDGRLQKLLYINGIPIKGNAIEN